MFRRSEAKRVKQLRAMEQIALQRQSGIFSDDEALLAPDIWEPWFPGRFFAHGQVIKNNGQLFRVMPPNGVTSELHQPPSADTLAIYRPIQNGASGTPENPIPFVFGMDVLAGLYYLYEDTAWRAIGDMIPCVWPPGTPGVWQWEKIERNEA
ncbi:MAG: hypothetical protein FWC66_05135 [Oscillospiraceae bacterium]|nr:hypothetical protein [Oscillospiraceae bacterium]